MSHRGNLRRVCAALSAFIALASCAESRAPGEDPDAALDAALDASADVAAEPSADTASDASVDTTSDASVDAALDRADTPLPDVAPIDVAPIDVAPIDVAPIDVAPVDVAPIDVAPIDVRDAAVDASVDARTDTGVDAVVDTGPPLGGCVSGATGTYVARFRWTGSGPRSRASVTYEANTLPDHARWRVTANSRSIGYTPVYDDTFLAVGGLDLSGTVFIDVELSTAGLSTISNVSLAVNGRSFNTTASGSFAWQTFDGTGAAPAGLVANSAPYEWYRADATRAFRPGNSAVLLRITPGPPSGSLVVSRVELCFDAR
jgi:hypothetical protein